MYYNSIIIVIYISFCVNSKMYIEVILMSGNTLKIRKRGEDGNKVISVRIKEDLLNELDKIAKESNYSRNELINLILRYGIDNLEII